MASRSLVIALSAFLAAERAGAQRPPVIFTDPTLPPYTLYGTVDSARLLENHQRQCPYECERFVLLFNGNAGTSAFMEGMRFVPGVATYGYEPLYEFAPGRQADKAVERARRIFTEGKVNATNRIIGFKMRPWSVQLQKEAWRELVASLHVCVFWMDRVNWVHQEFDFAHKARMLGYSITNLYGPNKAVREAVKKVKVNAQFQQFGSSATAGTQANNSMFAAERYDISYEEGKMVMEHVRPVLDSCASTSEANIRPGCVARILDPAGTCTLGLSYEDFVYQKVFMYRRVGQHLGVDHMLTKDALAQVIEPPKRKFHKVSLSGICNKFRNFDTTTCPQLAAKFPQHAWSLHDPANGCPCL